ncbi:MAG TPA: LacI family DNA-binding transcriptional regulator [Candidatus Limnocylindrales bacterium]|nr:LacI family DNA-binding transcriptional regulator [Candidatus Limnocylindrales bacterium]
MSSITEVARRAGVSVATASRVVSAADYPVSAATRERVLEAARELDYVPNALARGLHKSVVPVVGVIVHDITDPYFAEVVRGVEDAAAAAGILVITCSTERDGDRERSYVRLLRSMRAAGVIFAGSGRDDPALNEDLRRHVDGIQGFGAAVVHCSPHAFGEPEVGVDNTGGIAALVAELVALGHRRIAFLEGPASLFVARDRLAGYRRGLADAGIEPDERLVVPTTFDREGGAAGVDRLLAGDAGFTAICCANDLLALGAIGRLAERGIDVPGEVSVAGFDDIAVAAITAPALSTVRVPLREIGLRAFEAVERVLNGQPAGHRTLPTAVVLRASTATAAPRPLPLPFPAFVPPSAAPLIGDTP